MGGIVDERQKVWLDIPLEHGVQEFEGIIDVLLRSGAEVLEGLADILLGMDEAEKVEDVADGPDQPGFHLGRGRAVGRAGVLPVAF